ncbi:uncharacterized protein [Amphiura filiformis]|uniref:uncharacterized protein n=1 Tax=Amphiura filiformis TaxID=82378 RepID=UPI003B20F53B
MYRNLGSIKLMNWQWYDTKPKTHQYKLGNTILAQTSSHTYLGVEISEDLKWNNHINKITAKSSRVLGFIKRNLRSCPSNLRSKAFQTLVRPHLEYCSTVWNPHTKELTDKIETIQRRGARFVFSDYRRTSSVTTMLKKLDWKPLHLRRKGACVSMFHKIVNNQVAIPAHEFVQPVQTRKSSRLSHNQSYSRLTGRTDQYMNSYFPLTTKSWNNLPQQLVDIKPSTHFKTAVAEHIFSQEESTQRE